MFLFHAYVMLLKKVFALRGPYIQEAKCKPSEWSNKSHLNTSNGTNLLLEASIYSYT